MPEFVQALAQRQPMGWVTATVVAVTGPTITVNYLGGNVEDVAYLDSFTPVAGDVVHILTWEPVGMLALGRAKPRTTPRPWPGPTGTQLIVDPTLAATYDADLGVWTVGAVVGGPRQFGCWFYDPATMAPLAGATLGAVAIEVTLDSGPGLGEFFEHTNEEPTGAVHVSGTPFGVKTGVVGASTWVGLPIDWGNDLVQGRVDGFGIGGGLFDGVYSSSTGRVRLTPV